MGGERTCISILRHRAARAAFVSDLLSPGARSNLCPSRKTSPDRHGRQAIPEGAYEQRAHRFPTGRACPPRGRDGAGGGKRRRRGRAAAGEGEGRPAAPAGRRRRCRSPPREAGPGPPGDLPGSECGAGPLPLPPPRHRGELRAPGAAALRRQRLVSLRPGRRPVPLDGRLLRALGGGRQRRGRHPRGADPGRRRLGLRHRHPLRLHPQPGDGRRGRQRGSTSGRSTTGPSRAARRATSGSPSATIPRSRR